MAFAMVTVLNPASFVGAHHASVQRQVPMRRSVCMSKLTESPDLLSPPTTPLMNHPHAAACGWFTRATEPTYHAADEPPTCRGEHRGTQHGPGDNSEWPLPRLRAGLRRQQGHGGRLVDGLHGVLHSDCGADTDPAAWLY